MLTDPLAAGLSRGITLRMRLSRREDSGEGWTPAAPRRPWRRLGLGLAGLGRGLAGLGRGLAGLGRGLAGLGRHMVALGERLAAAPPSSARPC